MNNIYKGNIQKKALLIITKFARKKSMKDSVASHGGGAEYYSKLKENYA